MTTGVRFSSRAALVIAMAGLLGACSARSDAMLTGSPSIDTAHVALATGTPQLALTICNRLSDRRPQDVDLLVCRGDALTALSRPSEAVPLFTAALVFDPKSAAAKVGLGRIRLATDPAGAEAMFTEALTSDPRNAAALNNLGVARDLQHRRPEAQAAYAEAIAVAPDLRAPYINLAVSTGLTRAGR